jgi:hypothetical protein
VRGKALAARPDGDLYVAALRELYGLDDGGSGGLKASPPVDGGSGDDDAGG